MRYQLRAKIINHVIIVNDLEKLTKSGIVIPAKAGIQPDAYWMAVFTGMTTYLGRTL